MVRGRLAAAKARNRFGLPLAQQIGSQGLPKSHTRLSSTAIVGSIVAAVSIIGLLLAWIQQSLIFAAGGLLGIFLGIGLVLREHRSKVSSMPTSARAPLFDAPALLVFDRMLDQASSELPEDISLQLFEIKSLVAGISRQASTGITDEHFTVNDRMYLIECVRRYIPDSLQSYLLVPATQRSAVPIEGDQTAALLLSKQLMLILAELKKCELKIGKSSAERLLRQQRFLESKRT